MVENLGAVVALEYPLVNDAATRDMLTWSFGIERDLVEVLVQLASFVGALSPRLLNLGILSGNRSLLFAFGLPFLNFGHHPLGIPFDQGVLIGFPIGGRGLALGAQ